MPIHPSAAVDRRAEVHPEAEIGALVTIDGPVTVGARTRVLPYAHLSGHTHIGTDNVIHMGAVVGHEPQDLAFTGSESYLRIGDRNVIREYVQIHRGTKPGSATVIGDDNYFMALAHVGHNCRIGNRVMIVNGAMLGGYVECDDLACVSGNCVVHQYVRIGTLAFLRGLSKTSRDVPPFCIMDGTHTVRAINRVGLRRAGYSAAQIRDLHNAFGRLFRRPRNLRIALTELESSACSPEVRQLIDFIRASTRGVCFGPRQALTADD
jgi:UDP-N-acetylglucosamine acyltransferase